jgi:hypothetical protein
LSSVINRNELLLEEILFKRGNVDESDEHSYTRSPDCSVQDIRRVVTTMYPARLAWRYGTEHCGFTRAGIFSSKYKKLLSRQKEDKTASAARIAVASRWKLHHGDTYYVRTLLLHQSIDT